MASVAAGPDQPLGARGAWLVETSYIGGPGVLLARSRRWLLVDDDPTLERLDEWWSLLGTAGPVRERLVAALEVAYPLHDRAVVLVDLDDPEGPLTWGDGRVDVDGEIGRAHV